MISIVLPTFNEAESITNTINSIMKVLESNKINFEIIVSDDNSPDKTWEIVENLSKKDNRIRILRRFKNRGLSPAVIDAFKIAKGNYFLVMDADGQHDEKAIPKMFSEIKKNDIVVGSRYVKGGSLGDFPIHRIFVSKVASYMAYPLLRKKYISDPMTGFFMIKKELFSKISKRLQISGYKILLDILFASPNNIKIKEVPFTFKKRDLGNSKLGISVIIEYLQMLLLQLFKQNKTLLKFLLVGGSGIVVNLSILYLLVDFLYFPVIIASIIAIEISIVNNFIFNNIWTFSKRKKTDSITKRFIKFNSVSLIALVINVLVMILLMKLGIWYLIAQFIGILVAFVFNYILNNTWVFKKK